MIANLPVAQYNCCKAWLISWWRHQMETFSALLAICAENSPVPGEFPAQRPVTRNLFSLICVWINDWVNNGEAGNLRRYRIHYDVTAMWISGPMQSPWKQWDFKAIGVTWLSYYEKHNTAVTKWLSFCRRQLSSKRIFVNEIYLNANENLDDIYSFGFQLIPLHWRHNEHHGILIPLFLFPFVQTNIKENIKVCVPGFFRGIHQWPADSPHKGPVTRKSFPSDNVIIISHHWLRLWLSFFTGDWPVARFTKDFLLEFKFGGILTLL